MLSGFGWEMGGRHGSYGLVHLLLPGAPSSQLIVHQHANIDPSSIQKHLLLIAKNQHLLFQRAKGWKVQAALPRSLCHNVKNSVFI